ncbi:serine/threonine-protein kinase, partial [Microbispora sp. NPDC049633]|uniref:serine/threonine-protein kinase n=1 Tax=Microbispora sp. NPDC049633 TaxID=3154355 RepID=UPI003423BDF3
MAGRLGRVGPYALQERLGRGGMGEVYLAVGRRGDSVAVKMLRDPIENDPDARLRLEREVRALRRVESPYVAQVLDADLTGDRPYLVMEYIEGENLLDAVRRRGPLQESRLIMLAQGLAAALAIIHAAGVVHRDVKPANVLLGEDGPVLIDFGIAQVLDATRVTMTGTFLGTPGYCAPEVFSDETVGEPADVHGWAATVAFAATGRPTFGRGTAESQMYAVLNGKADLVGVPAALLPLVRAALHRDPARRPTAALLADRLSRLARASETSAADCVADRVTDRAADRATDRVGAEAVARVRAEAPPRTAAGKTAEPAVKGQAAERPRGRGGTGAQARSTGGRADTHAPEGALGIPTGNAALVLVALLAVPCVVASVIYPLATFAITAAFAVVTRAVWTSHWLVRGR